MKGRLRVKYHGLAVLATFTVGVSLGLPMFLWLRQPSLEAQKARSSRGADL